MQACAYVFSKQITLRILLLIGTAFYLIYYFNASDTPLWPAIFGTSIIASTSIFGLVKLVINSSELIIARDHLPIFRLFPGLEPGTFNKLMQAGEVRYLKDKEVLTKKGIIPSHLFLILEEVVDVKKKKFKFQVGKGSFIGEVSMMQNSAATATVYGRSDTKVIAWPRINLEKTMAKDNRFKLALEALIARDMARKLAEAAKVTGK